MNNLKEVFATSMKDMDTASESNDTDVEPIETPSADVETKDDIRNEDEIIDNSKETDSEEDEEESDEESEEEVQVSKSKSKRNSLKGRLNQKHAELMSTKELLAKKDAEFAALKAEVEALKNINKPQEEDELVLNDVDDLSDYLKKVVTKDDLDALVAKAVDQRLNTAKENMEKTNREQSYKKLEGEFLGTLAKYYNPDDDPDITFNTLDSETQDEIRQIGELFAGSPKKMLEIAKDKTRGVSYIRKFVTGELDKEIKAEKNRKIINSAKAVRTNIDSNNSSREYEEPNKTPKNFRGLFNQNLKKMEKGA